MIPRYEVLDISTLWSDESKFKSFLTIELALLDALENYG